MVDEDGKYSGYTYDYLMEIAKYTGWDCELVRVEGSPDEQALAALELLQNGEVDLLGGLNFNAYLSELFSYPGYSYGTNYMGIFVPLSSGLSEATLYTQGKIRVGVYKRNLQESVELTQFANMNNLDVEQFVSASLDELQQMVNTGELDGLLSTELSLYNYRNLRPVARFSPAPFYFATQKGNTEIVRQLEYAISTIGRVNPNFALERYEHYFSKYTSQFLLTDTEAAYISSASPLRVLLYDNNPPFSYIDAKTGAWRGITLDLLSDISALTGLRFEPEAVATYDEFLAATRKGADLCVNLPLEQSIDSVLTIPWHSLPISIVFQAGTVWDDSSVCAAPYFLRESLSLPENTLYYDSTEQCLQAVERGVADYAYVGEFHCQYLLASQQYNHLDLYRQQEIAPLQLSFGVLNQNPESFELLSILNKYISFSSTEKIAQIVYENTFVPQPLSLLQWVQNNAGALAIAAMLLIILILAVYISLKKREQERTDFENLRYDTLSRLSNEFFYEYNIMTDELVLPQKCADYFSCEAKLPHFSARLKQLSAEQRVGIWHLGDDILHATGESREIACRMPDDSVQWFQLLASPVFNKKQQMHTIGKIVNIQAQKAEQARLEQKARIDGLTGLYNVSAMKQSVEQRIRSFDAHSTCAFIVLDIDSFKSINDRFGHYSGDLVLVEVAQLLVEIFQPNLTGRLGGDEFVIYAENTTKPQLEEQCARLCRSTAERVAPLIGVPCTLSIGIALIDAPKTYDEMYIEADRALYQRKMEQKNGYTFFSPL